MSPDTKILIAGFGSVGRRHFRNLQTLGVTDIAFLRSFRSMLDTDEINGRLVFSDVAAALNWKPSAVVIANPTSLHMPVALAAAQAGVDIFIEKPISHSRAGCDEVCRLSRERDLVTMVGCQYRFHPLLLSARRQLLDGSLGAPLSARAEYADSIRLWHPWEDYRDSYSARPELGGGAILTLAHPLDYLYWLFGGVTVVRASAKKADTLDTAVADDIADLSIEFDSGLVANVHLDFVRDPPVHTLSVIGGRGRLSLDFLEGTLHVFTGDDAEPHIERVPDCYDRNTMFLDEMRHFLESVETRRPTAVPLSDGLAVLDVALAAKADAERHAQ